MPPKFEFPRRDPEDPAPAGVTIYPSPSFKALPPDLQQAVREKKMTLDEAVVSHHEGVAPGAYSVPVSETHIMSVFQSIGSQNEAARDVYIKLKQSEHERFIDALALYLSDPRHTLEPGVSTDGPSRANLYTALDTIVRNDRTYLSSTYTLKHLWQHAKTLEAQETKRLQAQKYATDLLSLLPAVDTKTKVALVTIFTDHSPKQWHEQVKTTLPELWPSIAEAITRFETEAYGTDTTDPRRQGRLTESFLALINPEHPKEQIGSFVLDDGTSYELWRLFTKKDLEEESATLGHCVGEGNTYYFKIRGDNPDYAIVSLRVDGVPRYTVEINIKHDTLLQFKGGGDEPVNSLPEESELVVKTLTALANAGLTITSVQEDFSYSIFKEGNQFIAETASLSPKYFRDYRTREVICGTVILDAETTAKDLLLVAKIPGLTIDAALATPEVKQTLEHVAGSLIDNSTDCMYPKLTHIGRNAKFENLRDAKGLERLTNIGGDAEFGELQEAKGLEQLTSIGGDTNFWELSDATELKQLTSIGGQADFYSLEDSTGLERLTNIGGHAEFGVLKNAKGLENLTYIGGYAHFAELQDATGLERLTNIGGGVGFYKLNDEEKRKIPALHHPSNTTT